MNKNRFLNGMKIVAIAMCVCISVGCLIDNDNNNESKKETTIQQFNYDIPIIDNEQVFPKEENHNMSAREYIEYLDSFRNQDYIMEYNENGYTKEELFEKIAPTMVSIVNYGYIDSESRTSTMLGTGNIYDITDKYVYILTCEHVLCTNKDEIEYRSIDKINLRFVDNSTIDISPNECYTYIDEDGIGKDLSIIKIEKSKFSEDTLNVLKTINIQHWGDYYIKENEPNDEVFYCYKYYGKKYLTYKKSNFSVKKSRFANEEDIFMDSFCIKPNYDESVSGTSGGGCFDLNGTYQGMAIRNGSVSYNMFYYIENILKLANYIN